MKIKEIRAAAIDIAPRPTTAPRVPKQTVEGFVSPMARYPEFARSRWSAHWTRTACVVTADDGTWGLGITNHGGPIERIINDHFAPTLVGTLHSGMGSKKARLRAAPARHCCRAIR